ncbi:hypothetical protein RB195_004434 [Necator americanus]|uniref:Transcription initiation factor TFIID subunit 12 n=1 Tax=Necator americanus TaxID=51031 RepID=A0ABR1BI44_NECAM
MVFIRRSENTTATQVERLSQLLEPALVVLCMIDIGKTVSGRSLSPEAEDVLRTYSDDLLEALIDAACNETKARNSHKIIENDVLRSVKAVSLFPARIVPRATLKIFDIKSTSNRRNDQTQNSGAAAGESQHSTAPNQSSTRPRRPQVDEAKFLEDIRKMKPVEIREPRQFTSHKLTLDPKDIRPRVGAAAVADVASAMERPARHFIGRPQPLITEDRGIVGPMPNIKPNVGATMKVPAFLQALQQRNEMLGFTGNNISQAPHPHPPPLVQQKIQVAPPPPVQRYYSQPQAPPQNFFQPPPNFPIPLDLRQAIQRLHPHQAARIINELLQRQRRQKWVDELERSALMSPTPPLTECDYPLCNGGDHYHCVTSRRSADVTLPLTVRSDVVTTQTPACTREESPPDDNEWEVPEGPVDHLDCAEYYEIVNSKPNAKTKEKLAEHRMPAKASDKDQKSVAAAEGDPGVRKDASPALVTVTPEPPPYFTPKEAERFDKCVKRLQIIANIGRHG